MRTLVVGDIHGAYKALVQVLERAHITPEDHLIFLGDFADGWSETPKVLDLLISLQNTHRITLLKGNHDQLCQEFLEEKPMSSKWHLHGGTATEKAYATIDKQTKLRHLELLRSMKHYLLDEQNRLFLHAGFTNQRGVDYEYFEQWFYWDRTLWELALSTPLSMPTTDIFFPKRLTLYKEIYIGHTPTTRFGQTTPMQRHQVWNVDTGAAFKGAITILDIDTKEFWQSDPVHTIYHNEKGRVV